MALFARSSAEQFEDFRKSFVDFDWLQHAAPGLEFQFSFGERLFSDSDPDGKANEFGIRTIAR